MFKSIVFLLFFCNIIFVTFGKNIFVNIDTGILEGINSAENGDVIVLQSGIYYANENNTNFMVYGKNISFISETGNPEDVILNGMNITEVSPFVITADNTTDNTLNTFISIFGITFLDCGLYNSSVVNRTFVGGVVYVDAINITGSVSINIEKSVFQSGYADIGGAIFVDGNNNNVQLNIKNTIFREYVGKIGSFIAASSAIIDISNTLFTNGNANIGSAIYTLESQITITNCNFTSNRGQLAAAYLIGTNATISNTQFVSNVGEQGGAIYSAADTTTHITSSVFAYNQARLGGAIVNHESHTFISDSNFVENSGNTGGAIYDADGSDLHIVSCLFRQNSVNSLGGAIFGDSSNLTLTESNFTSNNAYHGGVVYLLNGADLYTEDVIFNENSADERGGVVFADYYATATLKSTDFISNKAGSIGGAICAYRSTITLENSVVDSNNADTGGGAFYIKETELKLISTVAKNNDGDIGSTLYCEDGQVSLISSSVETESDEKHGTVCHSCKFVSDTGNWKNMCRSGLRGWHIAVIVVVIVVCVAIISGAVIFILKKKKAAKSKNEFYQM